MLRRSLDAARAAGDTVGEAMLFGEVQPVPTFAVIPPTEGVTGNIEAFAMYAGTSAGSIYQIEPASAVINRLTEEVASLLGRWPGRARSVPVVEIADLYCEGRQRLTELAAEFDDAAAATPVPACPGWTVKDVYAHLSGAAADAVAGRLDGVATDPWTARQVAERADDTLADVCVEWSENGPTFEAFMQTLGDAMDPRIVLDQWTHEQDVRGATHRRSARDEPVVGYVVGKLVGGLRRRAAAASVPPLRIVGSSREWMVGEGEPVATVHTSDFELGRSLIGRRTDDQIRGYRWDGDPEPYLPIWAVFPKPVADLVE